MHYTWFLCLFFNADRRGILVLWPKFMPLTQSLSNVAKAIPTNAEWKILTNHHHWKTEEFHLMLKTPSYSEYGINENKLEIKKAVN